MDLPVVRVVIVKQHSQGPYAQWSIAVPSLGSTGHYRGNAERPASAPSGRSLAIMGSRRMASSTGQACVICPGRKPVQFTLGYRIESTPERRGKVVFSHPAYSTVGGLHSCLVRVFGGLATTWWAVISKLAAFGGKGGLPEIARGFGTRHEGPRGADFSNRDRWTKEQ